MSLAPSFPSGEAPKSGLGICLLPGPAFRLRQTRGYEKKKKKKRESMWATQRFWKPSPPPTPLLSQAHFFMPTELTSPLMFIPNHKPPASQDPPTLYPVSPDFCRLSPRATPLPCPLLHPSSPLPSFCKSQKRKGKELDETGAWLPQIGKEKNCKRVPEQAGSSSSFCSQ